MIPGANTTFGNNGQQVVATQYSNTIYCKVQYKVQGRERKNEEYREAIFWVSKHVKVFLPSMILSVAWAEICVLLGSNRSML